MSGAAPPPPGAAEDDEGWDLVLVVVLGAVAYIGGGALYNMNQGKPWNKFPHVEFWNNIYGLALDGIQFVSSGGQPARDGPGAGGYTPVKEVLIVDSTPTLSGGATYASSKGAVETPFIIGPLPTEVNGSTYASSKGPEETPFVIGPLPPGEGEVAEEGDGRE